MHKKTDMIKEKAIEGDPAMEGMDGQPKKLILLNILDILKNDTDAEHTLSQKEIQDKLKNVYHMTVDRKTVKSSLMSLKYFGYDIDYVETTRPVKDNKTGEVEQTTICSDFYLRRDIEDSELRLLIDSLLFSRHLPFEQCKELAEKLRSLSNKYFKTRIRHMATMPNDKTDNRQVFYNIDVLDEAISANKKVKFKYLEYGTDLKQKPKKNAAGEERIYIVSPYQMAAKDGKYYLICNYDKYEDISNYRVDRIFDIEMLDEKAKPFEKLKGSDGKRLDLAKYMSEHLYMFTSDTVRAKLRVVNEMISDVIDLFGKEVRFMDKTEKHVTVTVKANEMSILQIAKNWAPYITILEPEDLRKRAIDQLKEALKGYE